MIKQYRINEVKKSQQLPVVYSEKESAQICGDLG